MGPSLFFLLYQPINPSLFVATGFLYKFDKSIIFTSEKKMKKHLQVITDRKTSFPLKNIKSQKTISYYLGNHKNIKKMYLKFLNA